MKTTFLHLSDLHFRSSWPQEVGVVFSAFLEDLKVQIPKYGEVVCTFSGDSVNDGANYSEYEALLAALEEGLTNLGISLDKRICIPGNHDISRSALKPLLRIQNSTLASIVTEDAFLDELPKLEKIVFADKLSTYKQYETNFAKHTCCTTQLGGAGWDLGNGLGIYCLNTALCSSAGLTDENGTAISDKGRLHIDTRALYRWINETESDFKTRVLIMHHPLEWLTEWAEIELQKIISKYFRLVFSGHVHKAGAVYSSRSIGASVSCVAPPLFTRKSDTTLGYTFVTLDTETNNVSVDYRQWTEGHNFVKGTALAQNDEGTIRFPGSLLDPGVSVTPIHHGAPISTRVVLQNEFDDATVCYASKKCIWIERDLAPVPETSNDRNSTVLTNATSFATTFRRCLIRAPGEYGLTSLGRYIALENHRQRADGKAVVMVDAHTFKSNPNSIPEAIEARCKTLGIAGSDIGGIIVDNWQNSKIGRRALEELEKYPGKPAVMILQGIDDPSQITSPLEWDNGPSFDCFFLWALTRTRVRELVTIYLKDASTLDEDAVTKKIVDDIDGLNIHRTPLNCLMLLKLIEQAFDDSPVNRTEMIYKVLYLLFHEFDGIPRYASRPDLKDCEYALGYLCEWLIRDNRFAFSRFEFRRKVNEYCAHQILDLDVEILLNFLVSENILVQRGADLEFRFTYWRHYFAAHRMHHNGAFAQYILSENRYSSTPEIIEFYTGIDRRRTDAVEQLVRDLRQMDAEFQQRTGINEEFNPFDAGRWEPDTKSIAEMQKSLADGVADSTLPKPVKDAIADKDFDRARPYRQEVVKFVHDSSLHKMMQTMRGAARALRNSDYVSPEAKKELLVQVMRCWARVCQVMAIVSRFLAEKHSATFEDILFRLDPSSKWEPSPEMRWREIMAVIPQNVVEWFQEDIFSRKMGGLLSSHLKESPQLLSQLMIVILLIRQRPAGWEREVEQFIVRAHKNSYYLSRVFSLLFEEMKVGFTNEETRQHLRRLAAMSIAKHSTGVNAPKGELLERAGRLIDKGQQPSTVFKVPDSKS